MNAGRLAPSPTGAQHLGNARTYLLAYWSARATDKRLVLRIEDVDSPRVKPWATEQAMDDLRWIGIDWDEGPHIQTKRMSFYEDALECLIAKDRAFPCTCTRKDIEEAGSAPHFDHEPKVYSGRCARWRSGDPLPPTGTFSWRFRPRDQQVSFEDAVLGRQTCNPAKALGAFPITQKSGNPSYQLAAVVDDGLMGIDEVVRGNDLVASTFRQIDLFETLGYSVPTFAHVPLVRGQDGRRLAKRHGDTRLSTFRKQGLSPDLIVKWAIETTRINPDQFNWNDLNREDVLVEDEPFS